MKLMCVAACAALCAGSVSAAGTHDSTGTITGQSTVKAHVISEGHLVLEMSNTHDAFDMAMDNHPFDAMSGQCSGGAVVMAPAASGGGVCAYSTENGDQAFVQYTVDSLGADGALQGTWVAVGGTGAMTGMSGGGRFTSLTDQSNGKITATLTGAVTMP